MKDILKFILIFLFSYGLLIYASNLNGIQSMLNAFFRNAVDLSISTLLSDAYLEVKPYVDEKGVNDPNSFYVVYGNPSVIKAEMDFATKQGLNEFKVSKYSFRLFIFQMFTVPLLFLISIFIATPIEWKSKLKSIGISLVILFTVIISKVVLLTLFNIANAQIGIYTLGDSTMNLVYRSVMALTLGFSIIFSFCLWLYFGFRKSIFYTYFTNFIKSLHK
jgi:hypothetical protein